MQFSPKTKHICCRIMSPYTKGAIISTFQHTIEAQRNIIKTREQCAVVQLKQVKTLNYHTIVCKS